MGPKWFIGAGISITLILESLSSTNLLFLFTLLSFKLTQLCICVTETLKNTEKLI